MGVVNATPDSFSDGGAYLDAGAAVSHALQLREDGADILDIGGESTRPGADDVPLEIELARTIPVIEGVRKKGCAAAISIATIAPTMLPAQEEQADRDRLGKDLCEVIHRAPMIIGDEWVRPDHQSEVMEDHRKLCL